MKKFKTFLVIVTIAVLGLYTSGVFAGGSGGSSGARSGLTWADRWDSDGDGKVSKAEYMASFTDRDSNGDGMVTIDEANERFVGGRDANSDNKVSRDEYVASFEKKDADSDGFVSSDEAAGGGGGK